MIFLLNASIHIPAGANMLLRQMLKGSFIYSVHVSLLYFKIYETNVRYSAVLRGKDATAQRETVCSLSWRRQGTGGEGSQMKQIKGEPWPPRETLTGHRDGIQMGDHERGLPRVLGLFLSLSFNL